MNKIKVRHRFKTIVSSIYLTTLFRILVGCVFIYASIEKIIDPAYFAGTIQNYQILPDPIINLVAIILPWLELISGFFLLTGMWQQSAALIISVLISTFVLALISVIIRGLDIECGCFGSDSSANWARIIEDLFLLAFSLQIVFYPRSKLAIDNIRV